MQGNPISYLGHTLTWTQGNRLNTFDNTSYAYNHQGLRTKKTINGVAHTYLWEGTRLISEAYNGNTMVTLYGSDGSVCGILYNGARYYFNKNLQGDVISIINMAGNTVAKYTYDAWGKILSVTDAQGNAITNSSHIALINPYRYRGYYFDTESNLYYLQTRYYDPETGRFISPDNTAYLDPESFTGLNLYAYCGNNPVMYSDGSRHSADSFWKTFVGVVIGVGLAVATVAAVVASGGTLLVPVLAGAGIGAGINFGDQVYSNLKEGKGVFEDINIGNVILGGLAGAAFATGIGGIGGAIAIGAASNAGMSALEGNSWANIGFSAVVGGLSAMAGYAAGKFISNNITTNTGFTFMDYFELGLINNNKFISLLMAFASVGYTFLPTLTTGLTRGVSNFIGNWIGEFFK